MKKNMGAADRIVRLLLAALMVYLYYNQVVTGIWGIVLLVVSMVFVLTSLIGLCPLYSLLGINSCRIRKQHS
ncbi:DUF2892 domain-containing protein [Paraflavitalea soli]|uniref:DUF2892 domain-containing protein n=1 Tax=Paraflavitalea soli TaxID=2315862 RepID=A0A3B7MMM1_9BACT|nr:DUF2892 domain-containing protein [Paraflavitalea soli]AXY74186.1 DUF2892 domain-containing protein [Paraflavitalea soli]